MKPNETVMVVLLLQLVFGVACWVGYRSMRRNMAMSSSAGPSPDGASSSSSSSTSAVADASAMESGVSRNGSGNSAAGDGDWQPAPDFMGQPPPPMGPPSMHMPFAL